MKPKSLRRTELLSTSKRKRVTGMARLASGVLLIWLVSACTLPDRGLIKCQELGARIVERPLADGTSRVANICVFADGSECGTQALLAGTCPGIASTGPVSPVLVPSGDSSPAFAGVFPNSLDEMVSHTELIFVGTVGSVERYLDFAGYGEDGLPQKAGEASGPPSMPTTDFRLEVEKVLRDDGRVASGEPIILRMVGLGQHDNEGLEKMGKGFVGQRYVFMLGANPDGSSYGPYYGAMSLLIIDGDILRSSDGLGTPLQFSGDAGPVTLEALIALLTNTPGK